jgi:hypothetical protein
MSEYQYYEFQSIDRALDAQGQEALRALSTHARITPTSFTNSYEWGDFKGDAWTLMANWFDLHLYLANWGSRRLMIRWPAKSLDQHLLDAFLGEVDQVEVREIGHHLVLDITFDEIEVEDDDDGSGWLAALAPLRAAVLGGDLRLFYLLWLSAVEANVFEPDAPEPMPGIGPITGALEAFANFFHIDRDLVAAASERAADPLQHEPTAVKAAASTIMAMADQDKTELLIRLFEDDPQVDQELRTLVRHRLRSAGHIPKFQPRTVGELRARAKKLRQDRERAQTEKAAIDRKRREEEAKQARRTRLEAIARRGESVWREIETEIERRNAAGYERAANLLLDLKTISSEKSALEGFTRRLLDIRRRHAQKARLMERLSKLG